jgi:hypothetical protein
MPMKVRASFAVVEREPLLTVSLGSALDVCYPGRYFPGFSQSLYVNVWILPSVTS